MGDLNVQGVALVTGAASGIGREIAFALAEAGVRGICFADIDGKGAGVVADESRKLAKNPKYRAIAVEVDVTQSASVSKMVTRVHTEFGRIDYCINSAGIVNRPTSLTKMSIEEFEAVMRVNVTGTALCSQAVFRVMESQDVAMVCGRNGPRPLGRGCIVNIGSVTSYIVGPKMAPYVTSKHALMGLTKASAAEGVANQIRVNAVCPSYVVTPMTQPMVDKLEKLPAIKEGMLGPAGRFALPEEVAGAVCFLCSPAASYINGIGMIIDAGLTLSSHT